MVTFSAASERQPPVRQAAKVDDCFQITAMVREMKLRAGDWVEVRSREEILATLDKRGRLDELPLMPQMLQFCGQRFKVYKRAHKTCDTVNPVAGRRVPEGIHLDLRCDGVAYGGCQAACLLFWKEAWLKPLESESAAAPVSGRLDAAKHQAGGTACTEEDVWNGVGVRDQATGEIRYTCQATDLPAYTTPLQWWDVRQYLEDYESGNVGLGRIFSGLIYVSYYNLTLAKRGRLGRPARWLYDQFQSLIGGVPFPRRKGTIPPGQPTPVAKLNLQVGELVRVKSHKEILATLDGMTNRGMNFDAELVPYCGGVYRVRTKVEKFVNENTGKLTTLKTPAVILEGVWCRSRYSNCRMFCPRSIYTWWREIWLERVDETAQIQSRQVERSAAS
jgi:hypothetical protein